jgi:hypothetical protein
MLVSEMQNNEKKLYIKNNVEEEAFIQRDDVVEVCFSSNVRSVGYVAFNKCQNLRTVKLPQYFESIDEEAFSDCPNLSEVQLPLSIISIGCFAFRHSGLVKAALPNSVYHLGKGIFSACDNLKELSVPGWISYATLQSLFRPDNEGEIGDESSDEDDDQFPEPGLKIIFQPLTVDLRMSTAHNGDVYAKQFYTLLCLIRQRLKKCHHYYSVSLPQELWDHIATFCGKKYLPAYEITTSQAGVEELKPYFVAHAQVRQEALAHMSLLRSTSQL